jgi:hypothetical protein
MWMQVCCRLDARTRQIRSADWRVPWRRVGRAKLTLVLRERRCGCRSEVPVVRSCAGKYRARSGYSSPRTSPSAERITLCAGGRSARPSRWQEDLRGSERLHCDGFREEKPPWTCMPYFLAFGSQASSPLRSLSAAGTANRVTRQLARAEMVPQPRAHSDSRALMRQALGAPG